VLLRRRARGGPRRAHGCFHLPLRELPQALRRALLRAGALRRREGVRAPRFAERGEGRRRRSETRSDGLRELGARGAVPVLYVRVARVRDARERENVRGASGDSGRAPRPPEAATVAPHVLRQQSARRRRRFAKVRRQQRPQRAAMDERGGRRAAGRSVVFL